MKLLIVLLTSLLFVQNSAGQNSANVALAGVYTDLVAAFQTKNDSLLLAFCYTLVPNETTLEYMRKNHLCYRGIPCEMDAEGMEINAMGEYVFPNLLRVRNQLSQDKLLDALSHVDSTNYKWDVEVILNEHKLGSSTPTSQHDFSLSMEKYDQVLAAIDSTGQTLDDYFLGGEKGHVFVLFGTEMPMLLSSNNQLLEYPIGEMILINNQWCLFTKPNVDYYIQEE